LRSPRRIRRSSDGGLRQEMSVPRLPLRIRGTQASASTGTVVKRIFAKSQPRGPTLAVCFAPAFRECVIPSPCGPLRIRSADQKRLTITPLAPANKNLHRSILFISPGTETGRLLGPSQKTQRKTSQGRFVPRCGPRRATYSGTLVRTSTRFHC